MVNVYKMELIKMIKRRNSMLLLIPCILSIVMALAFNSGVLTLDAAETGELLSCLDFTLIIWQFMRGLGIMSIIILLIGSFQFASEVEQGQIKIFLLRVKKREDIIIGKALAVLTFVVAFITIFWVTTILAYTLLIGKGDFTTGTFGFDAYSIYTIPSLLFSLSGTVVSFFLLILITFCLGTRFSMFFSFIVGMIIMYAGTFMAGMDNMKFMRVTPFYMENLLLTEAGTGEIVLCIAGSFIIIAVVLFIGLRVFKKTDIK